MADAERERPDFTTAAGRRRFYLERGLRRRSIGAGSNMEMLMQSPRAMLFVTMDELFGDVPAAIVGGVAARAYAPERVTHDLDVLVDHGRYAEAARALEQRGWQCLNELTFPNTMLGLYGVAWSKDERKLDLIASPQPWAAEALGVEAYDQTGARVVALPYLVLMKLDSARGIDQGDLSRMLGRASTSDVDQTVRVVERHSGDPHAAEDVRQYAELGALEYLRPDLGEK
ncbi:MAG TPA: hypothetical protein VHT05_05930 [Candidatus Elarobacter sp.]|nr:hypothetical protein [Candidatus Elarobacter sp.]